MARSLDGAVQQGVTSAVIIGSDIPDITTTLLARAFEKIGDGTVVLGPATDGGYYLIGLAVSDWPGASTTIFADMPWGTSEVLKETCRRLERLGLTTILLDALSDIDRPEDLVVWEPYRKA
jgi:hypothetical protein